MDNLWNDDKPKAETGDVWPEKPSPATQSGAPAETASSGVLESAPAAKPYVSRDEYWANKEARDLQKDVVYRTEDLPAIRRSTAYSVASTLAASALENDVLAFGSTAKGKKLDMYLGFVDLIAEHVYAKLNGQELPQESEEVADEEQQPETQEANLG